MKPVKCDPVILQMARAALIEKLRPRLEPIFSNHGDMPAVSGFKDPEFIEVFGPGLEKVPDSELVNQALLHLAKHVGAAPLGETGLPFFDDRQPKGQDKRA